ncbi:MAG: NAD(P)/FAD-dependent oxidoreductase, partial [Rhodospirillales bacterium]|nr:NAD(P)/FAD-dependent oxidoreductase [Rhodospirillales bacterium]
EYDHLVLATGARPALESVPGLAEAAHHFYDLEAARRLRAALRDFQGGRIVLNVNVPHKCPVAPLEACFLLHDDLSRRGLWEKTRLTYTYPIGRVYPIEPVAAWARQRMERLGIHIETFFNTAEVRPEDKLILSEEGVTLSYDLLITIPPHRGATVIEDSGLGRGGWVPTHPRKLLREGSDNVFVVGDTTNIPISKAGSTAHYQADTVADNLAALIQDGHWAREYDGKVFCFIETGLGEGTYIWFDYTTPPNPAPPSRLLHWSKLAYSRVYWLSARGLL